MTQSIIDKWKPIIESLGITGSKSDWLSEYVNNHTKLSESNITSTQSTFESALLPIVMKISAKTIANNLVSVQPMGGGLSGEEIKRIDAEIKQENRDNKIDSVIEDKDYIEKKREDHPDYIPGEGASSQLLYFDYIYSNTSPTQSN